MLSVRMAGLALMAAVSFGAARPASAQDASAGAKQFKIHCAVCHADVAGRKGIGPSLFGVVGRPAGTLEGFHYTNANKTSGLTWDAATLDRYLKAPREVVPGTTMTFAGLKNDTQRADVIAYLATLK